MGKLPPRMPGVYEVWANSSRKMVDDLVGSMESAEANAIRRAQEERLDRRPMPGSFTADMAQLWAFCKKLVHFLVNIFSRMVGWMAQLYPRYRKWSISRSWDHYFRTDPIVLLEKREAEANLALWDADPVFAVEVGVERTWLHEEHGIGERTTIQSREDGSIRNRYEYHSGVVTYGDWGPPEPLPDGHFGYWSSHEAVNA